MLKEGQPSATRGEGNETGQKTHFGGAVMHRNTQKVKRDECKRNSQYGKPLGAKFYCCVTK